MKLKVVDLFSGLGGFSQGFLDRGHEVTRYDNDKRFETVPSTIIRNVLEMSPDDLSADIVLASPPCNCFSTMTIRYYWTNGRPKNEKCRNAVYLVKHTVSMIHKANPHYWIIENPVGMMRHVLGKPNITTYWAAWYSPHDQGIDPLALPLKPTDLWGLLPSMKWRKPENWVRISRATKHRQQGIQGIKDPAVSARIPYRFSEALCLACESGIGEQLILEA